MTNRTPTEVIASVERIRDSVAHLLSPELLADFNAVLAMAKVYATGDKIGKPEHKGAYVNWLEAGKNAQSALSAAGVGGGE